MHNTIFPKYRSPINETIKGYQKMYIHTHAYTHTHTHTHTHTYTRRHVQTYGKKRNKRRRLFLQFSIFSTTPRKRVKECVCRKEREREREKEREREISCSFDYYKRFQSNICYRSAYWYRNDRLLLLYKARRNIEKSHATNRFNAGDVWSSQKRSDLRRARVWPRPRTK